jgi:hypothetical protein
MASAQPDPQVRRNYLLSRRRRLSRHLRAHGYRSLLGGITATGVLAGFLSASEVHWNLLTYIAVATLAAAVILCALGLRTLPRYGLPVVRPFGSVPGDRQPAQAADVPGRPRQLPAVVAVSTAGRPSGRRGPVRCDDPVYGAGLRVLLPPSRPLVVISSNRRDVGRDHELTLPLFSDHGRRTQVEVDLRPLGIPLPPYGFERELPEGGQDVDHTLAVKDLVFVPELAAALSADGRLADSKDGPVMLPEHCVDAALLAERDVVVVGGPDTNFWHGALFEPVARQFALPRSAVPLALDLRDPGAGFPVYGSRSISVQLTDLGTVFRHTRQQRADLDERLYPTYAMVLATRNPFAAAVGRSHWCVFVAGTRSLGTSGAVLSLVRMLAAMREDAELNFCSLVPSTTPGLSGQVSAVLVRTTEVEQAMLRRGGELIGRRRRTLAPEGIDPYYSDTYVPVGVEYLAYSVTPGRSSRRHRNGGRCPGEAGVPNAWRLAGPARIGGCLLPPASRPLPPPILGWWTLPCCERSGGNDRPSPRSGSCARRVARCRSTGRSGRASPCWTVAAARTWSPRSRCSRCAGTGWTRRSSSPTSSSRSRRSVSTWTSSPGSGR